MLNQLNSLFFNSNIWMKPNVFENTSENILIYLDGFLNHTHYVKVIMNAYQHFRIGFACLLFWEH